MPYIRRSLEPVVERAARQFPVVVLTGPRQSGKTTLLRRVFGTTHRYASLESPDVRAAAAGDPRGFLDLHGTPVVFDEVQHAPELLPYIKERVGAQREVAGQYVLTGSQNLLLLEKGTESLAGRAAMLRLLPLSRREAEGRPDAPLPWESPEPRESPAKGDLWEGFLGGATPSWRPGDRGTWGSGTRAMCRPTWSGMCGPFARWGT